MGLVVQGRLVASARYTDNRGEERGKVKIQTSSETVRDFGCSPGDADRLEALVDKDVSLPFLVTERTGRDGTRYTFIDLAPLGLELKK